MKAGITGHQDIGGKEIVDWVYGSLLKIIKDYNIDEGLTSLAIGADQLFAEALVELKIGFTAVIPCDLYENTFSNKVDLENYHTLCALAKKIINQDFPIPSEKAFFEAGKRIVESTDILIAVWDGHKARGIGGTGDIVSYAVSTNRSVVHIDIIAKSISEL